MSNLQKEHTPEELMELYIHPGNIPRLSIIIDLGNFLLDCGGRDKESENFLCSVLTDKDGLLALALDEASDQAERQRLFKEFMESCYAFLSACRESLDEDTIQILNRFQSNPPYPGFMQAVKDKIRFSKMEKSLALTRRQWKAAKAILHSREEGYPSI
ncbi:MAG: hypothetical protein PHF50_04315 [Patescibacteria group bacterium]|nr:hypothetical protein [Patescibacteria group bacterium]